MPILDYSLSNFKVPGLTNFNPAFGSKKTSGGLSTMEITRNEMMPFMKQRPISGVASGENDPPNGVITTDSTASPIEFDATFAVGAGVTLQLANPVYEGQKAYVVASFDSGASATILLGTGASPDTANLVAHATLTLYAVKGKWRVIDNKQGGESTISNVINAQFFNPGTISGRITWKDPAVSFNYIQIEDLLNPGQTWNVSPGTQYFEVSAGDHNYIIRVINLSGSVIAAVTIGDTTYLPVIVPAPATGNTTPRNLAQLLLGREVNSASDVNAIIMAVSKTIRKGKINNLLIGDFFGLKSINISAGNDTGGAFFATLTDISGHGRNLDFVIVAKNAYSNKNYNATPHVIFHSRNVLSAMTSESLGGHYMNSTSTNAGGYAASKGRAYIMNQVKNALGESGVPVNDLTVILPLSRRVANGGSSASGADSIVDNVFLPTEFEIFGANSGSSSIHEGSATQAYFSEYYNTNASRVKYRANGSAVVWWLASPVAAESSYFCFVDNGGSSGNGGAGNEFGIAPAFSVG